jgi:hypothetical protein
MNRRGKRHARRDHDFAWKRADVCRGVERTADLFSDVKPVAWGDVAQSSVRLEAAFLLLTVENLAAVCAAIALAAILTLWARSRYAISFR